MNIPTQETSQYTGFAKDVFEGLTAYPKKLSSKYIYDTQGDKLFQDIMNLPEYYLTNCEFEILDTYTKEIASYFKGHGKGFDLIELGAGDGLKTKLMLRHMVDNDFDFIYKPIDISQNAINSLTASLQKDFPKVNLAPEKGEYFEVLEKLKAFKDRKKVIVVLGSNIGNLKHAKAIEFLKKLKNAMNPRDMLFMGFDQKKNPQTVLDAYNDPTGVTAAFNKNLLVRINNELDGNFNLDNFIHWETYDPETGTAKSFLVATKKHSVTIKSLNVTIDFEAWETIHTEISQKYDAAVIQWLAKEANLAIETCFYDSKNYYANYIFKRI